MWNSLTQKIMILEFELNHSSMEATQNICCAEGEDAVDHQKITR